MTIFNYYHLKFKSYYHGMYRSCFASNIGKKGVLEYEVMRERMVI